MAKISHWWNGNLQKRRTKSENHNKTGAIKAYIYHRNLGPVGWRRCLLWLLWLPINLDLGREILWGCYQAHPRLGAGENEETSVANPHSTVSRVSSQRHPCRLLALSFASAPNMAKIIKPKVEPAGLNFKEQFTRR